MIDRLRGNLATYRREYQIGLDERRLELLSELLERHGFDIDVLPQIDIEGAPTRDSAALSRGQAHGHCDRAARHVT